MSDNFFQKLSTVAAVCLALVADLLLMTGCHSPRMDKSTVVFLIESSPTNLDPRIGTDAQSEHIDELHPGLRSGGSSPIRLRSYSTCIQMCISAMAGC